jgi:uncharacterized membrane protein
LIFKVKSKPQILKTSDGGGFGLIKKLRNYFFTGIFVLLPIVLTLKLLFWGFAKTDAILGDLIYRYLHHYFGIRVKLSGLGLITLLLLITLTGIVARNYLGKKLIGYGEKVLNRIPLVNSVYGLIKQIAESLAATQTGKGAFRKVVLIEYPRSGMWSLGFLTGSAFDEANEKIGTKLLSVYVSTPPNPTNGFVVMVPEENVKFLDMSVEEGLKLIISIGVITPEKSQQLRKDKTS